MVGSICHLGALGEARIICRLHAGTMFEVFLIESEGKHCCLKVPAATGPDDSSEAVVFGAERLLGDISTSWSLRCRAGEMLTQALLEFEPEWDRRKMPSPGALLWSEAEQIRASRGRWNHHVTELVHCDVNGLAQRPGLLMPFLPGTTFGALPRARQLELFPRMMPAFWDALSAARHGDLNGSNILVAPQADRFALIDPGAMVVYGDEVGPMELPRWSLTFVTTTDTYPILPPYYVAASRLADGASLREHVSSFAASLTLSDHAPPYRVGKHTVAHAVTPNGGRFLFTTAKLEGEPHPADLLALGVMYYQALTGVHPFYDDSFRRPAWVGLTSVDDQVEGLEPLLHRLQRGVAAPSTHRSGLRPAEDALALALLDLRVPDRGRLVELVNAVMGSAKG